MPRTLHRVITVAGFLPDPDWADIPLPPPAGPPIVLPPYTRRLSLWAHPYDGPDPDVDTQVPGGTTSLDLELIYGDGVSFTRAFFLGTVPPGSRAVSDDLTPLGDVWVRVRALNTPQAGTTHLALFWEKLVA